MRESSQALRSLVVRFVAVLVVGSGTALSAQQGDDLYAEDLALAARLGQDAAT